MKKDSDQIIQTNEKHNQKGKGYKKTIIQIVIILKLNDHILERFVYASILEITSITCFSDIVSCFICISMSSSCFVVLQLHNEPTTIFVPFLFPLHQIVLLHSFLISVRGQTLEKATTYISFQKITTKLPKRALPKTGKVEREWKAGTAVFSNLYSITRKTIGLYVFKVFIKLNEQRWEINKQYYTILEYKLLWNEALFSTRNKIGQTTLKSTSYHRVRTLPCSYQIIT